MTEKLYICCIVMQDPDDPAALTGLARPAIAASEGEALIEVQAEFKSLAPEISTMRELYREVKELPRSFVEQAAIEVLGWKKPE